MAENNTEDRHANRHHPHQNPQGPAPAATAPPQARDDGDAQAEAGQTQQRDPDAQAQAVAAKRREVAQGMRTSSARPPGRRRGPPDNAVAGDIADDGTPRGVPVSTRIRGGQRTMSGIAQRDTLGHNDLVQQTSDLVSQFKADPSSVDPVQVQLLSVQAMVSYGGDINQLKNELGRLRKEVELWRSQGPEEREARPKGALPGKGARDVRFARQQERRNGRPIRGRARG